MADEKTTEAEAKNPNEDSMVTSNLAGKKVDANPENPDEQPADETNLITAESQKGKKVDGDPELESDKPTAE